MIEVNSPSGNLEYLIKGMPYAQLKDKPSFDWFKALDSDLKNWEKLESKASDWVTCACGNLCSLIPRDEEGAPVDYDLLDLGVGFFRLIKERDAFEAKYILHLIEKRSSFLINEILNSKSVIN